MLYIKNHALKKSINISVPTSWSELLPWQREKICFLLLDNSKEFEENLLKILRILFQRKNNILDKIKTAVLFSQVSVNELFQFCKFILEDKNHFVFPPISKKLDTPKIRLSDCSIKQFSVIDSLFFQWKTTQKDVFLRQMVASLYRLKNKDFDVNDLPTVAEITDKISAEKRAEIGFVYSCVREYILNKYPLIFKTQSSEIQEEKPIFKEKNSYTPFSKIIATMAMDSVQPLGNLHQCNVTRVYDFFDIFQESIKRQ